MDTGEIIKKQYKEIFNPVKQSQYSPEQIKEMKALGFPKPDDVSWPEWMGPAGNSHVHEAIIYAAAMGATNKAIADDFGFTQSRISIIVNKPEIKKKIKEVQTKIWGEDAEQKFKSLLPQAIEVLATVVKEGSNDSTKDKISASKELLDRALGKSKQSISVESNLLGTLISKLDQENTRDVTHPELPSGRDEDSVDKFVNEFIEEDYKVGKRDKNGG